MCKAKKLKFVAVGKLGTAFRLCRKPLSSNKKRKSKKIIFERDVIMTLTSLYDTRPGVVINHANFDHYSFGRVKAHTQTQKLTSNYRFQSESDNI